MLKSIIFALVIVSACAAPVEDDVDPAVENEIMLTFFFG
jgi:hypothetical protein